MDNTAMLKESEEQWAEMKRRERLEAVIARGQENAPFLADGGEVAIYRWDDDVDKMIRMAGVR